MVRKVVTLITPPSVEPVSLKEAKSFARISGDDDDAQLVLLITAARQIAEEYTRRAFITQTLKLSLDLPCSRYNDLPEGYYELPVSILNGSLPNVIELPRPPAIAITSINTYSTANAAAAFTSGNYTLIGTRFVLNNTASWPSNLRSQGALEITYTAGYGPTASSVPAAIRQAILMQVTAMYDSRGMCDDVAMSPIAPGAEQLLRQYRVMDGLSA